MADYWETTQRVLQGEIPIVKRPKLTEALLKKPPFRFLHDVISESCRQTGYAKGLYTREELTSTNIKDKESKLMYLQKIIDCVGITLHAIVPARPLKIIAGLEPEQTNIFLQMLAAATMMDKETSTRAVASVLAGGKQPPPGQGGTQWKQLLKELMSPRVSQSPPLVQQSLEELQQHCTTTKHHSPTKRASSQNTKRENIVILETTTSSGVPGSKFEHDSCESLEQQEKFPKVSKKGSKQASSKSPGQSYRKHESQPTTLQGNISNPKSSRSQQLAMSCDNHIKTGSKEIPATKRRPSEPTNIRCAANQQEKIGSATLKSTSVVIPDTISCTVEEARSSNVAPTSTGDINYDSENEAKTIFQKHDDVNKLVRSPTCQEEASLPLTLTSAREEKCTDSGLLRESTPPMVARTVFKFEPRPISARKAPPTARSSVDKGGAKFMQGMGMERPTSAMQRVRKPTILLDNELKDEDDLENIPILLPPQAIQETSVHSSMEVAGQLVCDLLEGKEKLEDEESVAARKDEQTGIILGEIRGSFAKKEDKHTRAEEIQKLKEAVLTLCQTANPLGKSMGCLQEDAETMSKEYQFWVNERDLYSSKLEEQKKITQSMLQVQSGRVFELEEQLHQQKQQINMYKTQILRNDEKIVTLLQNLTTRSTRWISLPSRRIEIGQAKAQVSSRCED